MQRLLVFTLHFILGLYRFVLSPFIRLSVDCTQKSIAHCPDALLNILNVSDTQEAFIFLMGKALLLAVCPHASRPVDYEPYDLLVTVPSRNSRSLS